VARRLDPVISDDIAASSDRSVIELTTYIESLIVARRRSPGDDLLSGLLAAEEGGSSLSHDELIATVILLLIAGHETTANLIGNGVVALLRNPDALRQFRADPDCDRTAIEELLRYDGPIQMTQRITLEPVTVGTEEIPAGRIVVLCIGAANHDPAVFAQPDALDVTRNPNPHLSFSTGSHFCLGASLARTEARLALRAMAGRLDAVEARPRPQWRPGFTIRGVAALPLHWRS
jgi:cytochrome P450